MYGSVCRRQLPPHCHHGADPFVLVSFLPSHEGCLAEPAAAGRSGTKTDVRIRRRGMGSGEEEWEEEEEEVRGLPSSRREGSVRGTTATATGEGPGGGGTRTADEAPRRRVGTRSRRGSMMGGGPVAGFVVGRGDMEVSERANA